MRMGFFEKYLKKSQCLCLLFESRKLQREEDVDAVFVVYKGSV